MLERLSKSFSTSKGELFFWQLMASRRTSHTFDKLEGQNHISMSEGKHVHLIYSVIQSLTLLATFPCFNLLAPVLPPLPTN